MDLSDQAILPRIGNYVQHDRIKLNITQNDLAQRTAISRSTLSFIEPRENSSLLNLIKVLRILDALYVLKSLQVTEN